MFEDFDPRRHNYMAEVLKMDLLEHLEPGTVNVVTVMHDEWCALLKAGGRCDCNPEIVLSAGDGPGRRLDLAGRE